MHVCMQQLYRVIARGKDHIIHKYKQKLSTAVLSKKKNGFVC